MTPSHNVQSEVSVLNPTRVSPNRTKLERKASLHTLIEGTIHVYASDLVCNRFTNTSEHGGADNALFYVERNIFYSRDLFHMYLYR